MARIHSVATRETRAARGAPARQGSARQRPGSDPFPPDFSQPQHSSACARFENDLNEGASIDDLALVGALLGLEVSIGLHPVADVLRDAGHLRLARRFRSILAPGFRVAAEVLLPRVGDRRAWDLLLRLGSQLVGVELETRIRDTQWLVRRIRERERDGGADVALLVLSDSAVNRRLLPDLLEALGSEFGTSSRSILSALRSGRPLPGSGVILVQPEDDTSRPRHWLRDNASWR